MVDTLQRDGLSAVLGRRPAFSAFIGFDGFVDRIHAIIGGRTAEAEERMGDIATFARHIAAAAGRSTNVERRLLETRAGGNAVLTARTLQVLGGSITLLANLGRPLHPVFEVLARDGGELFSMGQPCDTDALEFFDGKVMLTNSRLLTDLNYKALVAVCGGSLTPLLAKKDALVLTNWTMMPRGTALYEEFLRRDLPGLHRTAPILCDIADPARRDDGEICALLDVLSAFAETHTTYLSVNRKEMERMAGLVRPPVEGPQKALEALHRRWPLEWILHRPDGADSYGREGYHSAPGFFTPQPRTTTGGGDSFNGGFLFGLLNGLPRPMALLMGNAVSGTYVRVGHAPQRREVEEFLNHGAGHFYQR
jgi:sugar/nucleoside kinase (ribokinase family)